MVRRALLKTVFRDLLRRPLQTALMVFGVALGVSILVAIDSANLSATRSFDLSTEAIVGRATHQVRGGPTGLPEQVYRWLRAEIGIRQAAPVVEGIALAPDQGEGSTLAAVRDPVGLAESPRCAPGWWRSGVPVRDEVLHDRDRAVKLLTPHQRTHILAPMSRPVR